MVIGWALMALGSTAAAQAAAAAEAAVPASTTAPLVRLNAGGWAVEMVPTGTQVKVVAAETGTIPRDDRPAVLEILGGYEVRGETEAHALRRCAQMRCEIDPAIRTQSTWTYQAFLIGKDGMVLAKSRIVKVEWIKQGPRASAP